TEPREEGTGRNGRGTTLACLARCGKGEGSRAPLMPRHELLETLGATPDRVASLAHGLSATRLTRRPGEGEWSMAEILNHLLVGERDVIFVRLQRILREDAPTFASS